MSDKNDEKSPLVLTETIQGMFMAVNIYEGDRDFFSEDVSAAYEFDDGRPDAYPLSGAVKFV
jgi:hypothetical protein